MVTSVEMELLREIADCQGMVDNDEYIEEQKKCLQKLRIDGFVALSWRLTPKGKEEVKTNTK